ncbi:MAG TPA: nitroreductase family protein [Candidatus Nanoarchaeia archaeon]|nr:nitroreductase family protein [Candidatus Nanoarchaeia archaeon]
MTSLLDIIKKRRSIRKYLELPLEWDKVVSILEAGRHAPSAGNLQHRKFIVVTDPAKKRIIAEACLKQYWMEGASAIIVICSMTEKPEQLYGERGKEIYSIEDCAMAAQNMILMAHDLGIGSCVVGAFEEEMMRDALSIPSRARPILAITLGYPDEVVPEPPRETLESSVFLQRYASRISNVNVVLRDWSMEWERQGKNISAGAGKISRKLHERIKHHVRRIGESLRKKKPEEPRQAQQGSEEHHVPHGYQHEAHEKDAPKEEYFDESEDYK